MMKYSGGYRYNLHRAKNALATPTGFLAVFMLLLLLTFFYSMGYHINNNDSASIPAGWGQEGLSPPVLIDELRPDERREPLFQVPTDRVVDTETWFVITTMGKRGITNQISSLCSYLEEEENAAEGRRKYRGIIVEIEKSENDNEDDLASQCKILTIEEQNKLPYRIAKHSYGKNSLARKNLGYLYAIHRNASIIFDADPVQRALFEPLPFNFDTRKIMDFGPFTEERKNEIAIINPYRFFGLSHLQPRAFPLKENEPTQFTFQPWISDCSYLPDGVPVKIAIQQGLFKLHPDASKKTLSPQLDNPSYFARPTPWQFGVAVDSGTFSPLTARNSAFYPMGFWGLLLPFSNPLGDIFRGYWVQRILWDTEMNLAVTPTDVKRNINDYEDVEEAYSFDDQQKARALAEFLNDWRHSRSGVLDTRILSLFRALRQKSLIDDVEYSYTEDWLRDLRSMDYPPITTENKLWSRSQTFKKPENPVISKGKDDNVKKRFIYMTQTEQDIPAKTLAHAPIDSDVIVISWKRRSENNATIFYPASSWTEGRNRLFQEALEAEKYRGYQYEHMIFTDDDFTIECTRAGLPKEDTTKCFEYFQQMLDKYQPAIGDCDHPSEDYIKFPEDTEAETTWLDAYVNSFHREAVDQMVPYNRTYDLTSWVGSQGYVRFQIHTLYKGHVMAFTKVYCYNHLHREYQRGMQMWDDIGRWIRGLLPDNSKHMLQDWPGGYIGKGTAFAARKKERAYDDMCSNDVPNVPTICRK